MNARIDSSSAPPVARQLAAWTAQLHWNHIPASVQRDVMPRVVDSLGLALAAADTAAVRAATDWHLSTGGIPESNLIGPSKRRMPASHAAMVHAVAAHCRDFDDTFPDSVVHPGSVVVPTALAVAQALGVPGERFGTSVIAGYEVAARLGAVAGRGFHLRGLHATGIVGPMAAAATAGSLLGLSPERMSWAFGLAASMAGGLLAFTKDGGWSKWLHAGWAVHGGITAAQLAHRGFIGPEHVLDGGLDLYSALLHGSTVDRAVLTRELGTDWHGARAQFKFYPCAHVIHPYIDGLLRIVKTHDLQAVDIEEVNCDIAPWAAAIVSEPRAAKLRFDSELEVIASLPYQLAVAALDRQVDLHALSEHSRGREDVARIAARIVHRCDASLGRGFDGRISVRMRAGQSFSESVHLPEGSPARILDKFAANTTSYADHGDMLATAREMIALQVPDWHQGAELLHAQACAPLGAARQQA